MNETEKKIANKKKMLTYWESELKVSKDKEAIQATINRLSAEVSKMQSIAIHSSSVTHEPHPHVPFDELKEIPKESVRETNPILHSNNLQKLVDVFGLELVKLKIDESDTITEQHKADMLQFIKYKELLQNPLLPTEKTTLVFDKCQMIDLTNLEVMLKKWEVIVTNSKIKEERKYVIEKMKFIFENW